MKLQFCSLPQRCSLYQSKVNLEKTADILFQLLFNLHSLVFVLTEIHVYGYTTPLEIS